MPMYDVHCDCCLYKGEEQRKIDERDNYTRCPNCSQGFLIRDVAKKMNFELKGDGWARDGYVTGRDYEREM